MRVVPASVKVERKRKEVVSGVQAKGAKFFWEGGCYRDACAGCREVIFAGTVALQPAIAVGDHVGIQ